MPFYYIATLFTLVGLAIPVHFFLPPHVAYELGWINEEPPLCKLETPFEAYAKYQKNNHDAGKSARFSHRQSFICSRNLFERNERHTSYDFFLQKIPKLIAEVSAEAAKRTEDLPDHDKILWTIRARSSVPPELETAFLAVAYESLTAALGPHKVLRKKKDAAPTNSAIPMATLALGLRPVVDEDLMIEAELTISSNKKTFQWKLQ